MLLTVSNLANCPLPPQDRALRDQAAYLATQARLVQSLTEQKRDLTKDADEEVHVRTNLGEKLVYARREIVKTHGNPLEWLKKFQDASRKGAEASEIAKLRAEVEELKGKSRAVQNNFHEQGKRLEAERKWSRQLK